MSSDDAVASFYPNLCQMVKARILESDEEVYATTDFMTANFEVRHFIHRDYLISLPGGSEFLERHLVEASPPCRVLTMTKKEGGDRVLGMLSKRLPVKCLGSKTQTWYKLKLQHVLVVEDMPVPLHVSVKSLQRDGDVNGELAWDLVWSAMLTVERVPASYRNHPYWDPNDQVYFVGAFGTEQTDRVSGSIAEARSESHRTEAYTDRICAKCATKNPTQQSSRCKVASYCNRECQVAHWPIHKKHCTKVGSTPTP